MDFSLKVTHQNRNRNEVNNTQSFKQSHKNSKENYTKTEEKLKIHNSIKTWPPGNVRTYPVMSHSIYRNGVEGSNESQKNRNK